MLRLRTFGSVDLEGPADRDLGAILAQPKRLALLVYLAAGRPLGARRRDELLGLFWPELDDVRARDALNQALRFLRQALGPEVFVRRGGEDVGVDPGRIWCDAVAFQAAIDDGRPAEALALYQGEFLQGFFIEQGGGFEQWMERERAVLRESAARGARQLAEEHASAGSLTLAIDWGRRALDLDPDDERALRRLLRLHGRAGDRAGALRLYEAFARRFEEEFGCEPSAETRSLLEQLKAGRLEGDAAARPPSPLEGAPPDPRAGVGEFGDRYQVVRTLGAGGMATVYLTRDVKHDREVALKVLKPEIAEGLARERFLREIRIAGQLQHPNIVPLFDSGEAGGRLFFVMAHIQGETLRERLNREKRLAVAEVEHLLREIAGALGYAHDRGIIHRDIKPENILLIDRRAVLTDFGIARAAHVARTPAGRTDDTLTQPGISLGTPAYMAPEQAAGHREIDQRADLYALGVLGYEMLAGQPPFGGASGQQVLAAHLLELPIPVSERRPDTPAGLAAVVMRCLEKKPADRPDSAHRLLAELDGIAREPRSLPWWRGRAARIAAAVGLLLAGIGAAGPIIASWSEAEPDAVADLLPAVDDRIPPLDPRRLAVLYFEDLTPAATLAHVASGLTEDLIDALSRVRGLHVISPTGVRPYKGRPIPPDSLARLLSVGTVIDGSVTASGGRIRVTVRLVDGSGARQLQSSTLERPLDDVLRLRDTLAVEVTQFLRTRLGREIRLRDERAGTQSQKAWELIQEAAESEREGAVLAGLDAPAAAIDLLLRADERLRRAEALDPLWAVPSLRRARAALSLSFVSPGPAGEPDSSLRLGAEALREGRLSAAWLVRGLELTEQVLARQPGSAEAHALRGELRHRLVALAYPPGPDSLLLHAKADLRDALEARPGLARAWNVLGQLYRGEGRFVEAAQAARNAFEADAYLEDVQSVLSDLFFGALYLGRFDEARTWCRTGLGRFPSNANFAQCELTLMGWSSRGRREAELAWQQLSAIERRDSAAVLSPMWGYRRMLVASVLARSGLADSARAVMRRVHREAPDHPGSSDVTDIEAYVRLQLGERDAALRLLENYLEAIPSARPYVARSPWYRDLHTDPRFRALVGLAG
jgi:DNA-binding SARP family transcriptional activator/TolB-like protein/tRNA A-37 threonylcarbamoyl transferase component Bud32